jgi:zinc transport system substrate-binding protein
MRYTISILSASAALALTPAWAEVPRVMTDIPPVHALVAQVMGDLGQPDLLLDRGANAHSFQLRPSQAANLADAGLIVWIGPDMTPWLDRAVDGLSPDTAQLRLLEADGTFTRMYGETGAHDHEAHAEKGHDDHGHDDHGHEDHAEAGHGDHGHDDHGHDDHGHDHDHADEGHAHDGTDPHAWLDPANGQLWLGLIAAELSRLDPENAATYDANAAAAAREIAALDASLADRLASVKDKPFVVFHDAYGYFAGHYGLTIAGSVALGDAASPGAAHLSALQEKMGSALCIFPEAQHDPKLVQTMADATGTRIGGALDPEGAGMEPGPQVYGAILTGLADTILSCLAES